jgi:hypothetical protein
LPACVHDLFDDGKQVERRAGKAVDPRRGHDIAGAKGGQHPQKFASVGSCARHLLAENLRAPGGLQLLKLGVERLAVGADSGIADQARGECCFGHNLRAL